MRQATQGTLRKPYEVFDLERVTDSTGTLYVAELAQRGGRFERFVFISDVPPGQSRGGHAHKRQAECLVCIHGSVDVRVESHGNVDVVPLYRGRALFLPAGYWRDLINFSAGAVLAVLAAEPYSESDYIRDRRSFDRWDATGTT